jgi:hypothetical protein
MSFTQGVFRKKGVLWVRVDNHDYELGVVTGVEMDKFHRDQQSYPFRLVRIDERTYWRFKDRFYWENDGLNADEVYALLVTRQWRERGRIKRAEAMVTMGEEAQDLVDRS